MIETFFWKLSKKGAFHRQRLKTYNFTVWVKVFQLIISFKKNFPHGVEFFFVFFLKKPQMKRIYIKCNL